MSLERVKFICPICGEEFYDMQYTDDEWYKLGTRQTLCPECGKAAIRKILGVNKNEILSRWPSSNR